MAAASIFFDIELPNPTTWFYFSGLLAVALFFKFSRVFSIRNFDVLTLYLFTPGLLLLMEAPRKGPDQAGLWAYWGYLWLMVVCLWFLIRCLADLALVRRPALAANLNLSGLGWLAGALFVSLVAVAGRQPIQPPHGDDTANATDPVSRLVPLAIEPVAPPDVDNSRLRLWSERGLAVLCHLSVVVALVLIGWRHFDDVQAGMSAATFYLLLPYTFLLLPDSPVGVGRWDHAWPMALMLWTVFTYRRPILAGAFLGLAAGTAPLLLFVLPAWLSFYRQRGATRFLLSFVLFAGLGVAVLAFLLYLYKAGAPPVLDVDWLRLPGRLWKEPPGAYPGFWQGSYAAYRVPVFIASLALVVMSAFWPNKKNLAEVLALSAACLIGVQFWHADRYGVYVLWFLPLVLLLVFRPNLSSAQPPVPAGDDWLARLGRRLGGRLLRLLPQRRPPALAAPAPPVPPSETAFSANATESRMPPVS
jgi:hypothetical protein